MSLPVSIKVSFRTESEGINKVQRLKNLYSLHLQKEFIAQFYQLMLEDDEKYKNERSHFLNKYEIVHLYNGRILHVCPNHWMKKYRQDEKKIREFMLSFGFVQLIEIGRLIKNFKKSISIIFEDKKLLKQLVSSDNALVFDYCLCYAIGKIESNPSTFPLFRSFILAGSKSFVLESINSICKAFVENASQGKEEE